MGAVEAWINGISRLTRGGRAEVVEADRGR